MLRWFPDNPRDALRGAFGAVDWYFLGLRLLIAAAGLLWFQFFQLGDAQRQAASWTFAGCLLSSVILYAAILHRPKRIRQFYLMAVLL